MSPEEQIDLRFGDIAVSKGFITQEVLEHALEVQETVCERARVQVPIGRIMVGMDFMTQEQVDAVIAHQEQEAPTDEEDSPATALQGLNGLPFQIIVAEDFMTVMLMMAGADASEISLSDVKHHLAEAGIVHGLVSDEEMAGLISGMMTTEETVILAQGTPIKPAIPDEWELLFDTDPLRVGTMGEDGRMDWKDRGEIPHVSTGEVLAKLHGGTAGKPGMDVYGQHLDPVPPKEPHMKTGKGAERSEDGRQVLAKITGMPKLLPDGRIDVLNRLVIDGDVGVETGHVEFDGVLIVQGVISSGYRVIAKELQVREIQEATVTVHEHLVASEGVYGSTIQVGGNFKASHVHDSTLTVTGDLVVMREIIDTTAVITGRCLIQGGAILSSVISAKKGIQVNDVGTPASKPSMLTVGVDRQLTIDLNAISSELADLKKEAAKGAAALTAIEAEREALSTRMEDTANEQDDRARKLHKLEEKVAAMDDSTHPKWRDQINESIVTLSEEIHQGEASLEAMMEEDDALDVRFAEAKAYNQEVAERVQEAKERSDMLKESAKLDSGHPVLKAYGTILAKTEIASPRDRIEIEADINHVQFMETQDEETGIGRLKQMKLR